MQPFKQDYLILSAQTYRMVDENTGVVNEGISVWYLPTDNLQPVEDEQSKVRGDLFRGVKVAKLALPLSLLSKIGSVPGLYSVTMEMVSVQQKLQVRARDLDLVGSVKLSVEKKQ